MCVLVVSVCVRALVCLLQIHKWLSCVYIFRQNVSLTKCVFCCNYERTYLQMHNVGNVSLIDLHPHNFCKWVKRKSAKLCLIGVSINRGAAHTHISDHSTANQWYLDILVGTSKSIQPPEIRK